ncbi:ribosome biogenesis GTP-binding protein YihA/YsxC [Thermobrachium celere]|uniref:Probable GTP-binding protein EngB n=1 Tax=Thermobrachium celere DSM 8682 TaxID=941824 RepID=R7RTA7_9CLOT|nr:ribosome biogenesis GTP-binding protein YihA/YsxC [Thermobrachium celere]GFR36472.1 putative GTP-binding protein EngB [Thermobrachium celere]CDF59442.1 GTP-binding protein EngB [Thermobrachium celere DSM 8682]
MIIRKAEIECVAALKSQYPTTGYPEVAFAGRSNVGKSSLINTLVNRKSLARTSSKPGKTRTINFYNINDNLYLVDLPGYGYAKVSKEEKKKWGSMIEGYLNSRDELKLVILLVDIRHEPTQDDKLMLEWMRQTGKKVVVVATKSDKLSNNQIAKQVPVIKKALKLTQDETFILFSSETRRGKEELWEVIKSTCGIVE